MLRDGDVVVLPRAELLVQVDGDVGRPAIYELKKGEGVRELIVCFGAQPNRCQPKRCSRKAC